MKNAVVEVQIKAALPTNGGCAVFLGTEEKVFVIYVDQMVGGAIMMFVNNVPKERPQTHDLFGHVLSALGAKVQRVVVNDVQDGVYFGRLILSAENELAEKKIVEIDARPSDCIALAVQSGAPIYIDRAVWDVVEDMTEVLEKVDGFKGGEPGGGADEATS
jgi:bifunctional DNase/RNase